MLYTIRILQIFNLYSILISNIFELLENILWKHYTFSKQYKASFRNFNSKQQTIYYCFPDFPIHFSTPDVQMNRNFSNQKVRIFLCCFIDLIFKAFPGTFKSQIKRKASNFPPTTTKMLNSLFNYANIRYSDIFVLGKFA